MNWSNLVFIIPVHAKASKRRVSGDRPSNPSGSPGRFRDRVAPQRDGCSGMRSVGGGPPERLLTASVVSAGREAGRSVVGREVGFFTERRHLLVGRCRLRGAAGRTLAQAADGARSQADEADCSQSAASIRKPPGSPDQPTRAPPSFGLVKNAARARHFCLRRFVSGGIGNETSLTRATPTSPRAVLCPGCVHGG